ncbi:MAG TPA: MFS transporter [Roseiflexaceae bacterium]|nr:MFS transporter [Roseiflexaceae bacterium]
MRALVRPLAARYYYGWVMLVAVSATEVVSWGILYYAFAVFVAPMQAALGWSQVAIGGAFSLALLCSGLAAVPLGRWLDRHGPRASMTAGSVLGSLLLVAWSSVQSLWAFYLILAGMGVAMAAVLYEPAFAIVATWFRRQRGRALTVLTFCGAWASFLFIPLSAWLVQALGWRQALLALAGILAAATIPPHLILLRRRPQDLGQLPDGAPAEGAAPHAAAPAERGVLARDALREPGFWWLSLAFAVSTFASVALTMHLIPYLVARGHSQGFAATVAGLFGLMSLAGRLLLGPLGDRYPRRWVTAGLMAMQLAGLAVLALAPTALGALVYVALFGAGTGTMTIMRAALLAERYGAASYGSISGAQSAVLAAARTLAPLGASLLASLPAGYPALLWTLAGLSAAGLVALLQVKT